jgi:hypothetical protein
VLAISTGDLSVTTRTVANSIEASNEPASELVETAALVVHPPDETALEKERTSKEAESESSGTRARAEPLPPQQLSSQMDLKIAAVAMENEAAAASHCDDLKEADSLPKLSFWARMKRLVIGR